MDTDNQEVLGGNREDMLIIHNSGFSQTPADNSGEKKAETYLTARDFSYSIGLLDEKINSLYKLCRYISDQQQKNTKSLKKLVAIDELTEGFWNVSYSFNTVYSIIVLIFEILKNYFVTSL